MQSIRRFRYHIDDQMPGGEDQRQHGETTNHAVEPEIEADLLVWMGVIVLSPPFHPNLYKKITTFSFVLFFGGKSSDERRIYRTKRISRKTRSKGYTYEEKQNQSRKRSTKKRKYTRIPSR